MATKKKNKVGAHSNGNGGGMWEDHQPDRVTNLAGFWRPEKGGVITGLLVEKTDKDYFVIRVSEEIDVISRDRNTGEDIQRTADKGREVGLSCYADLRGLERKTGFLVRITCLGKEKYEGTSGETLTRWKFATQVSKQIEDARLIHVPPMRSGGRQTPQRRQAPQSSGDEDIPF